MASFQSICESRSLGRDFWDVKRNASEVDEKAKQVILRGLEIRPQREDGQTFWDDFISVISNNGENAAALLGVTSDVVSKWSSKIRDIVDKVRDENSSSERSDMTQTG